MAFTVIAFTGAKLYPGYGLTAVVEIEWAIKPLTYMFALLAGAVYVFNLSADFPRSILFIAWGFSLILVPLGRFALRNRLSLLPWYGFSVLFVAKDSSRPHGLEALRNCRCMGWNPLAVLHLSDTQGEATAAGLPVITSWQRFLQIKKQTGVDTVLVSISNLDPLGKRGGIIQTLSENFKHLVLVFPAGYLGSVWVQPRDLEGRLGLELSYHLLEPGAILIKELLDYLLGGFLFLLLLPVLIVIAIILRLDSPGPIFFRQERLGKAHQRFKVLKFRTMVVDAEERLQSLLETDRQAWLAYQRYHKLEDDPRMTRVGRWLRKFSLDELPQLWNVLRGEMSLVGPRAYMPSELDDM